MNDVWGVSIEEYVAGMRAANRSAGTIKLHRHYLSRLRERYPCPWGVRYADLIEVMANSRWGGDGKKSARSVFRSFYRWAHGMGYLVEDDPALRLPVPVVSVKLPRPTPELVAKRVTRDPDYRIAFMASLARILALRAGEIAVVHSDDWQDGRLTVHGKGRRQRRLRVHDERLVTMLDRMDGWAFPGRKDGHLSAGTVSRYLSEAMPDTWTAHTLRHRALTDAYADCQDILAVGKMAGHTKTDTTMIYVEVADEALDRALMGAAKRAA